MPDLGADPRWSAFAEFVAPYGLRAAWSTPIVSADGEVLGTFANYYRRPCDPTPSDLRWVDVVRRTAAIAVERGRVEAALSRSQERLHRLNEELEWRVRQEVAAREAAQARLAQAQRMEALGQLAGGIAHDFNNVLQAVSGGVRLMERRADDAGTVRRLAGMVAEATERGASVTQRLLGFARHGELQAEPVDAAMLLDGLREVLAHTLGSRISVRVELASEATVLLADKSQLETMLINLATNARDAMPGGGSVTLSAANERVADGGEHEAGLSPGPYVRISVADGGTGMSAALLARAAEPFFTTKPMGEGTGMGLAMARGFAAQSGGGMAITSEEGRGTTVTVWLPAADGQVARHPDRTADASAAEAKCNGGARVLLVDDNTLVRAVLAAELRRAWLHRRRSAGCRGGAGLARCGCSGGPAGLRSHHAGHGRPGADQGGAAAPAGFAGDPAHGVWPVMPARRQSKERPTPRSA